MGRIFQFVGKTINAAKLHNLKAAEVQGTPSAHTGGGHIRGCQPKDDWRVVSFRNIQARRLRKLGNDPQSRFARQLPLHFGSL